MGYPGGKKGSGSYQTIINLMPPHRVYIEPFLGGGAVLLSKRPAELNIGIERDRSALEMMVEPAASSGLTLVAGIASSGDAHRRISPFLAGPAGCSTVNSDGRIQPRGHTASSGDGGQLLLFEGDGIEFLATYPFHGDELVYCDPPYLRAERRSSRALYRHEMTDVDHRHLLRVLRSLKTPVILSGYSSALYAAELKRWNAISYQTTTRGGRPAAEWLWFNFEKPLRLHDYRYIGADYRERERIKRKRTRWLRRWEAMPTLERQALLSVLDLAAPAFPARLEDRQL